MTLKYAAIGESDTSKFVLIDTDFGTWNTSALNGYYTLYLTVQDSGGLRTVDQRLFYIDNPVLDMRDGIKKTYYELSFSIPANAYAPSAICVERRLPDEFSIDPNTLTATDLIYEIHPSIAVTNFKKPVVLSIDYSDIDLSQKDENKLRIFRWDNQAWQFIGGNLDRERKIITTAIKQIGIYGLFESHQPDAAATASRELEINCQPRVISPNSTGFNAKTAISFELSREATVDIKIYNSAGRLIDSVCENVLFHHGVQVEYWDGRDFNGNTCPSGLYIVTVQADAKMKTRTVVVMNNVR